MTGSFYKTLLATLVLTSFSIISALPPEEEKTEEQVNADSVPISEKIEVKTKKSIDEKGEIKDVDIDYEAMKDKSTAVFYGTHLPTNVLSQYKRIIVEPDNVKAEELMALRSKGGDVFAYVSIGEISPSRKWYKKIQKDWILGDNKVWDSKVMDLASSGWQDFLIDSVIAPLWEDGYRGLFLDTMDSFYIFAKDAEEQKIQTDAEKVKYTVI